MIFGDSEDNDGVGDVDAGASIELMLSRLTGTIGSCGIDSSVRTVIFESVEDNDGVRNVDAGASTELMLSRLTTTGSSCGKESSVRYPRLVLVKVLSYSLFVSNIYEEKTRHLTCCSCDRG